MSLKPLRILAVGKLKTPYWKDAAEHYKERLRFFCNIEESLVKDANPSLPVEERVLQEESRLMESLTRQDIPIVMDETGKHFTSVQFSSFFKEVSENAAMRPCFIIGGAFGLGAKIKAQARHLISLGPMTLPHEMARVFLYEQLYRAESILRNIPYHH